MSTVAKIFLTVILAFALSGCETLRALVCEPQTNTSEVVFVPLKLPAVDPIVLDGVTWYVLTPQNAEQKFKEIQSQGIDAVFFGLTDKGYEAQSLNEEKLQGHILLLRDREKQTDAYYKAMEDRLNADNKKRSARLPLK